MARPSLPEPNASPGVTLPNELPPEPPKVAGVGATAPPGAARAPPIAEPPAQQPAAPPAGAIASKRPGESVVVEVRRVGDCVAPRRVLHAVLEGGRAGREA